MPSTFYVTNGNDSGSGSLRQAFADAVALGNQTDIYIDEDVEVITLTSGPLATGGINLTVLNIIGEDPDDQVVITIGGMPPGAFRFLNQYSNNGLTIDLENIIFTGFSAPEIRDPVNNTIVIDPGDGGAIKTDGTLSLLNCTFLENTAYRDGGAIHTTFGVYMNGCEFNTNEAGRNGGAIYSLPNSTDAGIEIHNSRFLSNQALAGDGGAIYFYTAAGVLGIYGDDTRFVLNAASGQGGGVYQYGGSIEAISSSTASIMASGFQGNGDGGDGGALYLDELNAAHIDVVVNGALSPTVSIRLRNLIPPSANSYWSDINDSRVAGDIDSNWPYN